MQPDVVVVELCQYRVSMLKMDERTLLREAKEISLEKLQQAVRQVRGQRDPGALASALPAPGDGPLPALPACEPGPPGRGTQGRPDLGSAPEPARPGSACRGPCALSLTECPTGGGAGDSERVRVGGLSGVLGWAGGQGVHPAALGGPARAGPHGQGPRGPRGLAQAGRPLSAERGHVGADADAAAEGVRPHHGAAGHGARRRVPGGLQGGGPGSGEGLGTGPRGLRLRPPTPASAQASKVPFCKFHLGDRPIPVTFKRAIAALSFWQKVKLAWGLCFLSDPIR